MLISEAGRDPDDSHRVQARSVSQQLAKVQMVGAFELVLDQHPGVPAHVLAQNVGAEGADGLFLGLQFELDAQCLSQKRQVLRPRQPRGEV